VTGRGWPVPLEAATLLVAGTGLWLELIPSPPLTPRATHLRRAVLGAVAMWVFWILAYTVAMSTHRFYSGFHHAPGGLSAAADQQIEAAVSWFVAAVAFMPVIFWNAVMWLRTDEDPDAELVALLRAERRRGMPSARDDGAAAS
jgi:cytochrome c oxidase assembly factor CtaG